MNRYLRLMRFDKPAGIALLWAPTAWALWIANLGHPAGWLVVLFLLGTVCMRAAGCIINDLADRKIDCQVQRTRLRPLTHGEISIQQAVLVLGLLLICAVFLASQLPRLCWYEACFALLITMIYPFGKRFLHAPQLLLGIAFSLGIPMAYAASARSPDLGMGGLMLLNFCWIVGYDTIYAAVDMPDDLRIGVKSTAILFGSKLRSIVTGLGCMTHGLWMVLLAVYPFSVWFIIAWLVGLGLFIFQYRLLAAPTSAAAAMRAFLLNALYGLVMWLGLVG